MERTTPTNWMEILIFLALGFVVSWGTISFILFRWFGARESGRRGRDFHHARETPVPRLGGVGLVLAFLAVSAAIYFSRGQPSPGEASLGVIVLSSLAMFVLGFWDDWRPLRAQWKLVGQIAIAAAVYYFSDIRIEIIKNPVTEINFALGIFGFFATVTWLVTLTNLINLIDGIDGLAGGICLMLMCLLANLGSYNPGSVMLLAVGVAGALIAFLKFNYPPAKIYMGDGGAYFVGFLIGILSIVNSHKGNVVAALIAPTFALALPLVDVGLAVLRRGLPGLPLFRPDRKHIHHHLITLGFSRARAVLILYTVSLVCLLLAFSVFYWQGRLLPLLTGLLFLVLVGSGHLCGYTRNWFTIGSRLGKSLALRKETRYALTLSRWLQMEVERQNSAEQFWIDYLFVIKRLRFSRVKLVSPEGSKVWESEDFREKAGAMRHGSHELNYGTVIEFDANREVMSEMLFDLLSDLSAETWYKAASRWRSLNKNPLTFLPPEPSAAAIPPKKTSRLYASSADRSLREDLELT